MPEILNIADFLEPVNLANISQDEEYHDGQYGKSLILYTDEYSDLKDAEIVLVGCSEQRGAGPSRKSLSADIIRRELYQLYDWHPTLRIADAGNVRIGATLTDTYAALKTVIKEIISAGKTAVIIGGSHDLMLAQYNVFCDAGQLIEAACVDAKMDLNMNSPARADNFLMEMLTGEPNFVRHYNHIGFQSYLAHPEMLQTLDKLRFDCFRVGKVRENIDEMEPVIRNTHLFSFDISAIAHSFAPVNKITPNGFTGDEACSLMRYAGLSSSANSIGIYGYDANKDHDNITAKQISQMLWYFFEGRNRGKREADLTDKESFNEYHLAFGELTTAFLQSKRTGRWWIQLPDQKYIPCSYSDYLTAVNNEFPERWLRAQERSA